MKDNHQAITPDDGTDLSIDSPWRIGHTEEKNASDGKGSNLLYCFKRGARKQHLKNSICSDGRVKSLLNLSFSHGSNQFGKKH